MRRRIAAIILSVVISAAPAFAATEQKIGVVDMQRAVSETKEGATARTAIFKKTEQLNNELKGIQADFEKIKAEIEKEGTGMKPEVRLEKESRLQQKSRDFQKHQRDAQEEIKQMEADLLQKMITRLSLLLGKIGDEGGYAVIIDQSAGVRFFSRKIDVTPMLIKKADDTYQK